MDDFLLLWISLSLTFYIAVKSQCFPLSFHIPCLEREHTQILFSITTTIFPALKEMEFAIAGKDISKETGLTLSVPTETPFLWFTLLKALFLRWHRARATSSHISEDWKAACPHGNCSLLRAQDAPWLRWCLPIAFRALHVFCGCSLDPRFGWIVSDSADNYHISPCLLFYIVGQPQKCS